MKHYFSPPKNNKLIPIILFIHRYIIYTTLSCLSLNRWQMQNDIKNQKLFNHYKFHSANLEILQFNYLNVLNFVEINLHNVKILLVFYSIIKSNICILYVVQPKKAFEKPILSGSLHHKTKLLTKSHTQSFSGIG